MRRFYVRPAFQRSGIARQLATAPLARVGTARLITVASKHSLFWESLGFTRDVRDGHTHILNREGLLMDGQLVPISSASLPAIDAADERASMRFLEFLLSRPTSGTHAPGLLPGRSGIPGR